MCFYVLWILIRFRCSTSIFFLFTRNMLMPKQYTYLCDFWVIFLLLKRCHSLLTFSDCWCNCRLIWWKPYCLQHFAQAAISICYHWTYLFNESRKNFWQSLKRHTLIQSNNFHHNISVPNTKSLLLSENWGHDDFSLCEFER